MSIKEDFKPIEPIEPAKPRGKLRTKPPAKPKKITERIDFNFPKTLLGALLVAGGIGCNYVGFLNFASNYLLTSGIALVVAGVGLKINRVKQGRSAWQNEANIIKSLLKKGK